MQHYHDFFYDKLLATVPHMWSKKNNVKLPVQKQTMIGAINIVKTHFSDNCGSCQDFQVMRKKIKMDGQLK